MRRALLIQCLEQSPANGRIRQQLFERLFVSKRVEEALIVQRDAKERLPLLMSERIGRKAADNSCSDIRM